MLCHKFIYLFTYFCGLLIDKSRLLKNGIHWWSVVTHKYYPIFLSSFCMFVRLKCHSGIKSLCHLLWLSCPGSGYPCIPKKSEKTFQKSEKTENLYSFNKPQENSLETLTYSIIFLQKVFLMHTLTLDNLICLIVLSQSYSYVNSNPKIVII